MPGHMTRTWMAESSESNLKGAYDYRGAYNWATSSYSLDYSVVQDINKMVTAPWGWYFIPTNKEKWEDPGNDSWYKEQYCVLTFDSKSDLIQALLSTGKRL
mgnify:CR=1 FL=1|jgi:hypothetical protein